MSEENIERNEHQEYSANELVVETDHLELVISRLGQQPKTESDRALGLTKVMFPDTDAVDAACEHVRRQLPPNVQPPVPQAPDLHIERLLAELRALFRTEYAGWTVTLGKNRLVRGVELFPYARGGGEGSPVPANGAAFHLPERNGGRPVQVGLLDTKLYANPLLTGRYVGTNTVLMPEESRAKYWWNRARRGEWLGHATFIAGLILQRAPMAQLDVRSVLNDEEAAAPIWDVAKEIAGFTGSGVDILNLSFGCLTSDAQAPLVLRRAIGRLVPDVLVVASGGNLGTVPTDDEVAAARDAGNPVAPPNSAMWPAAMDDVVAVGATDHNGQLAAFNPKAGANGAGARHLAPWLDMVAPGVDVTSTYLDERVRIPDGNGDSRVERFHGFARWSGTSFAAAAVTGAVAGVVSTHGGSAAEALDQLRSGINDKAAAEVVPASHFLP